MANPILSLLAEARAKLDRAERKVSDAERERDVLRVQVAAFEQAARAVDAAVGAPPLSEAGAVDIEKSSQSSKLAAPQEAWNKVFQVLDARPEDGFGYDDIAAAASELKVPFKRPSLRTKMMNYANGSYVERLDSGRFRITDSGRLFFGINASHNENGEAEASPDARTGATVHDL